MAPQRPTMQRRGTQVLGAGLTLAVTVGLFAWAGLALDDWLATSPLFLCVLVLLGVVGGFLHLVKTVAPELLPFGRRGPRAPGAQGHGSRPGDPADRSDPDTSQTDRSSTR